MNATISNNALGLSTNSDVKEVTGDFLTGGATMNTSGSYGQMPPVDLFSQDFASLPALISGACSVQDSGGGASLGSGRNLPELEAQNGAASSNHHHHHHVDDANILRG